MSLSNYNPISIELPQLTISHLSDLECDKLDGILIDNNGESIAEIYFNKALGCFELHIIDKMSELPMLAGNYYNSNKLIEDILSLD